ncbi:hypothetical protein V9T40_003260 [Parthenolecanium corni]|uniref:Uncharacterized protein n=1 Tax=Parthenolecanium corni TaxID=536013 RepID=A0AAN9Y8Q0_9HEMI
MWSFVFCVIKIKKQVGWKQPNQTKQLIVQGDRLGNCMSPVTTVNAFAAKPKLKISQSKIPVAKISSLFCIVTNERLTAKKGSILDRSFSCDTLYSSHIR